MNPPPKLPRPDPVDVKKADAVTRRLRAGWHPTQLQALTILTEREASPKEIAVELGLTKARAGYVSHYVRELEAAGFVEEVRAEPRRGALEHYFKAIERPVVTAEEAAEWTQEQRESFTQYIITCVARDFGLAIEHRTLDADEHIERHITRTPLLLDSRGFEDLLAAYMQVFDRSFEIQGESDQRRAETGEPGLPVSSVLATIPMPIIERPATGRRGD
ncbi:MAG TPA: winged helix-turn-helix domain-containing protein [Solirubrobacterales bacterium]|nr:winged helix-turn-helix domain-containing protein [Solirubrobacterales bacterium]